MSETTPPKKSDLGVRTLSAIVMVAVAGTALWLGGWVWTAFVAAVALGVLWEWWGLVRGFIRSAAGQIAWQLGGVLYVGIAVALLIAMRGGDYGTGLLLIVVFCVIGTDVGAYFAGRTFGGPKIAPAISPSKTWSGLVGGAIGAGIMWLLIGRLWSSGLCREFYPSDLSNRFQLDGPCSDGVVALSAGALFQAMLAGVVVAIVAQTGDFFESWMKRRARAKDSGSLIPGHGGLFDRVDGLLAVCFVFGLLWLRGLLATQ